MTTSGKPAASGWWTIAAVVSAAVTLPFGESVIGVQLDAIAHEFGAEGNLLQWVVNAYMLTFATSILAVGVCSDRYGRLRFFALGLALTGVANVLAMFAPSLQALVWWRALAGAASGTVLATGPALLSARFVRPGRMRSIAFAAFGSAAGSGIAFGPLVGGLMMEQWGSWRVVFAVYLPFVGLSAALLPRLSRSRGDASAPIDGAGVVLFTLMLGLLIWLLNGGPAHATGRWLVALLAAGLLVALVRVERGKSRPAIDPDVFMEPVFRSMALLLTCWQIAVAVSMVYVPALVIAGLGRSPGWAGAATLPMAVALFSSTALGPRLVRRYGKPAFVGVCGGLMAAGNGIVWLALGQSGTLQWLGLLAGLVCMGVGGGIANGSVDNLALAPFESDRAGSVSGAFQTVRIGTAALAVAAAGLALQLAPDAGIQAAVHAAGITRRYAAMAGVNALLIGAIVLVAVQLLAHEGKDAARQV